MPRKACVIDPNSLFVTKFPLAVFLCGLLGGEYAFALGLSGAPWWLLGGGPSPWVGGKSESIDARSASALRLGSEWSSLRCELCEVARLRVGGA
jgi:hypothetical protein